MSEQETADFWTVRFEIGGYAESTSKLLKHRTGALTCTHTHTVQSERVERRAQSHIVAYSKLHVAYRVLHVEVEPFS